MGLSFQWAIDCLKAMANQTLQATAVKRLGWQVGCQRPAVPELIR